MSDETDDRFERRKSDDDGALNCRECPHCALWYHMDDVKPGKMNKYKCPNCGWEIDKEQLGA